MRIIPFRRFSFFFVLLSLTIIAAVTATAATTTTVDPVHQEQPQGKDSEGEGPAEEQMKYDCHNVGCSMNRRLMGPPVCGVDGISYYNECLAYCQGIDIAVGGNKGACHDEIEMEGFESVPEDASEHKDEDVKRRLASYHDDHNDGTTTPPVTISIMNQFQDEGFKFVAKRKFSQSGPPSLPSHDGGSIRQRQLRRRETGIEKKGLEFDNNEKLHVVRVTEEGYEYVAGMIFTEEEIQHLKQVQEQQRREEEEAQQDNDRELYGPWSEMRRVVRTKKLPNKYVGELDYKRSNGEYGEGGCSGTLVSSRSMLTAAHCIWELGEGYWYPRFAPGRNRARDGSISPYGNWLPAHITKFKQYKNTYDDTWSYDMAIVRLHPKKGKFASAYVGGYARMVNTRWNAKILNQSELKGYPSDKPNGQMWSSGKCPGTYRQTSSGTPFGVAHKCDNWYAMSGSGLMDPKGGVHGLLVSGSNSWTYSVLLYNRNYIAARRWAGLVKPKPPNKKKATARKGNTGRKGRNKAKARKGRTGRKGRKGRKVRRGGKWF